MKSLMNIANQFSRLYDAKNPTSPRNKLLMDILVKYCSNISKHFGVSPTEELTTKQCLTLLKRDIYAGY